MERNDNFSFLLFLFFCYFFWNFLLRISLELNGMMIFIYSLSQPFPTYYGLKWSCYGIILIYWIVFLRFFWNFLLRAGQEWNDISQPILAWNEAIMVFFNFLIFFSLFLEFYISRRVGTERKDNFYFRSFSCFSKLFWLEKKP